MAVETAPLTRVALVEDDREARERLVESGFPAELAARLATDARYDLHALIGLVESGCRPELAVRILAPLEGEPIS